MTGSRRPSSNRFDFPDDDSSPEHAAPGLGNGDGADSPESTSRLSPPGSIGVLDTRTRLVEAAAVLFLRQGYHPTGIKQILAEAGANSGSLYHYFPTKEDLLLAVLERYVDLLRPLVIQPVFDRISDPIERIFGILDSYRRMLQFTNCKQGCPLGNLALELSDSHDNVRDLIALNFTNWKKAIEQCLDDAADRLPDHVDRPQLASFILTVMEGGVMQARAHKSIEPFEDNVALLRDYFERLLSETSDWAGGNTFES